MSTASGSGCGDDGGGGDGVAVSEPSVDSMALWVEAAGGMKRGKIFGMGSLSRTFKTKAAASSSSNAAAARRTRHEEHMTQELCQLKQLLVQKDEEMKHLLGQKDEQIRVMQSQMQYVMRHLDIDRNDVPSVPPVNVAGHGHIDEPHDDAAIGDDADDDDAGDFIVSPP
ncbi:uncharacterized protein LOC130136809 [Syzygium oleosum]|uniref:uncharacterized protein LOC130136809 n=1 Tax=Syzygium oleosum TaxID=219896 RepID=UPI0024BA33DE|nr:uncharacterized protein LOC130136809 [Syzygium oleosum]